MAILRTYAEVQELDPTDAEQLLIDKCKAGEPCYLAWDVPTEPSAGRTIRADILRYLILGGCKDCRVDGRGVTLLGGYITGMLDLNFATANGATQLKHCYFENRFDANQTRFEMLNLIGSTLIGFNAQGAEIKGSVFLRSIIATATVNLTSTTIGGQLSCEGAQLSSKYGSALNSHSAKILGGVFLHPTLREDKVKVSKPFSAMGRVNFTGSKIGGFYAEDVILTVRGSNPALRMGNVVCEGPVKLDGSIVNGEVKLTGARISGDLTVTKATFNNDNGHALNAERMRVEQSLEWKGVEDVNGTVALNGAHVAVLDDDPENWLTADNLQLDGLTYDRIKGKVSTSPARMDWLKHGSFFNHEFRPQPYFQYAKFLRDTGHDGEARRVLETAEGLLRQDRRRRWRDPRDTPGLNDLQWHLKKLAAWADEYIADPSLKWVIGYGHAPFRVLRTMTSLIGVFWIATAFTWHLGQFAPNSAIIQVSQGWADVQDQDNPAKIWSDTGGGADWESFSSGAYAMDVVIPIINFGQTEAWGPSTTRGDLGWWLWWTKWFFGLAGWIVTALGAAAITGIIRRE